MFQAFCRILAVVLVAPLGVVCVATAATDSVGQGSQTGDTALTSIIHGAESGASEDAVLDIWLKDNGGWATCTGSLIAPNVVLTAYHCVARETPSGDERCPAIASGDAVYTEHSAIYADHLPAQNIYVSQSRERGSAADAKFVARGAEILDDATRVLCSHDIAVVLLDQPITNVRPLKIRVHEFLNEGPNRLPKR